MPSKAGLNFRRQNHVGEQSPQSTCRIRGNHRRIGYSGSVCASVDGVDEPWLGSFASMTLLGFSIDAMRRLPPNTFPDGNRT
jgi:hypothetical protein